MEVIQWFAAAGHNMKDLELWWRPHGRSLCTGAAEVMTQGGLIVEAETPGFSFHWGFWMSSPNSQPCGLKHVTSPQYLDSGYNGDGSLG